MEYSVKKTTELTIEEEMGILSLFNNIFLKERSLAHFRNQFLQNPLGYSFHSMIIDQGEIVGCNSYIPSYYLVNKSLFLFVTSADTMVQKSYRNFFCFYEMVMTAFNYMKKNGVSFVYAFANDLSYPVFIKSKLMKDIGSLNTYCLPYRLGGIRHSLKILDLFSVAFAKLYVFYTSLFSNKKVYSFSIEKDAESYNATRYKRLEGDYNIVVGAEGKFVYKLMEYEGVRSVFLIDVFEKSPRSFNKAVRYIIKKHQKEFDILLYVGCLPFGFHGMIRLPQKISPKKFHFVGKILEEHSLNEELVFNIKHWDVNLSNYDLL